jgi:hypothetical protein
VDLEPEHEDLLARLVEASRDVPRENQEWFMTDLMGGAKLQGPDGLHDVIADDVYYLRDAGLLRRIDSDRDWLAFRIAPAGLTYYARMKQRNGEPLERQEAEVHRFLNGQAFRAAYPLAFARWAEAETLLWGADSEREFTTVGHKAREAMQEFATEVVQRYQPADVDLNPTAVNRRLGAVIAMLLPSLGDARATLLKALGDYSEATLRVIQRQEHGGQKEGHQLTWQDARRVVFHTASVMYEFAISFEDTES